MRAIVPGILMAALAACTTLGEAVNPYKSNFICPYKESGRCVSVTGAYNESRMESGLSSEGAAYSSASPPLLHAAPSEKAYQDSVYKKLTGLLEEPQTPVIAPPKVMRVLLLPYKNEKDLYMYRYAYFMVDDFRWVLQGNPAMEGR